MTIKKWHLAAAAVIAGTWSAVAVLSGQACAASPAAHGVTVSQAAAAASGSSPAGPSSGPPWT